MDGLVRVSSKLFFALKKSTTFTWTRGLNKKKCNSTARLEFR